METVLTTPTASDLTCAIGALKPFLAKFGLIPSRVLVYVKNTEYMSIRQKRAIVQHEKNEDMDLAVESFMEMFLSDKAPPDALSSLMQALFDANNSSFMGDANYGAWYVRDIITLSCTYMPLQQALVDFLCQRRGEGQDQDQDVIQFVVTQMSNRQLLKSWYPSDVMQTLELQGMEAAIVHLLACMYATRIDVLKERLVAEEKSRKERGNVVAMAPQPPRGGRNLQQQWLHFLVQCIEMHFEQSFSQSVPEAMLSAETWASVYNCLAFGHLGPMGDYEAVSDAGSDAGDSVASDETFTVVEEAEEAIPDEPDACRERLSAEEEKARNMDQETRMKRTHEYVHGQKIQHFVEIFHHEYQQREMTPAVAPREPSELDDSCSGVTDISSSTENNSHVFDDNGDRRMINANFWAARNGIHTDSGENRITLHDYQEEVLYWAREGRNVAIFLPTGTGKTFVVLKYVQEHLSRPGLNRIAFLAPKVKLAEQQFHRFRRFFPSGTYFRCGGSRSSNAPFSELLDTYQVFVMTPQCLVEAVQNKEVQIKDFSMLVLDECHHVGQGKHAYMGLMGVYLDAKFQEGISQKRLPQVIGLTASPGVGSGKTPQSAVSHIKELCYKMDVEKICIVKTHRRELEYHVSEPKLQIHTCRRRKFDGFKKIIEGIMELVENRMITCAETESQLNKDEKEVIKATLNAPTLHRACPQYNGWVSNLSNKLLAFAEYENMYRQLFSMAEILIIYQKCLILNEDCESSYALEYLKDQASVLEDQVPQNVDASIERKLLNQFNRHVSALERACSDPEDYNPKLELLEQTLLEMIEKNGVDSRCMVFVRTIDLTKAIVQWMSNNPQLSCLCPGRMTGKKSSEGGMTRSYMADVVEKFEEGKHHLLVCTSVADEGLDFQACNVVVRYDYVTSLISMIQTRGRARQMDSQYCVLGNLSQGNVDKEKENLAAERLMHQAVDEVINDMEQNNNAFLAEMNQWQKLEYQRRRMEDLKASCRVRNKETSGNIYHLLCGRCQVVACKSSDFRMLDHSSRAVVARSFTDKWKQVETNKVVHFRADLEKIAKVHCMNCSFDWGVLVRYIPTDWKLPVLKIESFILQDLRTGAKIKKKLKWKDAPFHVEDIKDEELLIPEV